jgi:hypothetical protein
MVELVDTTTMSEYDTVIGVNKNKTIYSAVLNKARAIPHDKGLQFIEHTYAGYIMYVKGTLCRFESCFLHKK